MPPPNNNTPPPPPQQPTDSPQVLTGTAGNDSLQGGVVGDTISGLGGVDTLIGLGGDDTLIGGEANDTLQGGAGNDRLDGTGTTANSAQTPVDVADYSNSPTGVTVNLSSAAVSGLAAGTALDGFGTTDTLLNINAIRGSAFNDVFHGGNNVWDIENFEGGQGADTINGGVGSDQVSYRNDIAGVTVNLSTGIAIDGWGNTDTLTSIEFVLGSNFADTLTGGQNSGGEIYKGDYERFEGLGGADVINGGAGTNEASYRFSPAGVTVNLSAGTGVDGWGTTDTLVNIANLRGSAFADSLTGNASNNRLRGDGGDDTLDGGAGNDTADYRFALSSVTVNLSTGTALDGDGGTDTLISIEHLRGSQYYADVLTGDASNNSFESFGGNDTIDGGAGTLDTATYFNSTTGTVVTVSGTTATVQDGWGFTDSLLNVEVVVGTSYNDTYTGGTGNDSFITGAGNDTVSAGAGNDTVSIASNLTNADVLDGGAGNDTLFIGGSTTVTLGASTVVNFETLTLQSGGNFSITTHDGNVASGQTLNVVATSLGSTNTLIFDASAETDGAFNLTGGPGNTTVTDGAGNDTITTGTGNDTIKAGAGNDTVTAGSGQDTIFATSFGANDTFDGGAGSDTLTMSGGGGAVTFGASQILNIETVNFCAGNWTVTLLDANIASGGSAAYDFSANAATNQLIFDASAETDGLVSVTGGTGNDTVTGGALADTLALGAGDDSATGGGGNDTLFAGSSLNAADRMDGGAGAADVLALSGGTTVTFGASTMLNVETLFFSAGGNYNVVTNDANVASGTQLVISSTSLASGASVFFDAQADTDASMAFTGGDATHFVRTGSGALNDTIATGTANDTVMSGAGNDNIQTGAGDDSIFLNLTVADIVDAGSGSDRVFLSGGASVTLGASSILNVETLQVSVGSNYMITTVDANVASGATLLVIANGLAGGNSLAFDGSAETNGIFSFIGGAGNDTLTGGGGNDTFSVALGGLETVTGGAGNDSIVLGNSLDVADVLDGDGGTDFVSMSGGKTLTLGASTMLNVETLSLSGGGSYNLTTVDATVASGLTLTIDSLGLASGESLAFDGSAEANGSFVVMLGAGNDTITGGALNDTIDIGSNWTATDTIDGGAGTNDVMIASGGGTLGLNASSLLNIEVLQLNSGSWNLTTNDANIGSGQKLTVNAGALASGANLVFSAAAEVNGAVAVIGGGGNDTLIGGAGNDGFQIGAGVDTVTAGGGNDTVTLGGNLAANDAIDGGAGTVDVAIFSGATTVTFGASTIQNVETLIFSGAFAYGVTAVDNTVATGQQMVIDSSSVTVGSAMNYDGGAETDGRYYFVGGFTNETFAGGAGNDTFQTGSGDDTIRIGGGNDTVDAGAGNDTIFVAANLTATDVIDGSTGTDVVSFSGGATITLGASTILNVETLQFSAGSSYAIRTDDTTISSGSILVVDGAALASGQGLDFGSGAETNGFVQVLGGAGNDSFTGGALADTFTGNAGDDLFYALLGGNDVFDGGLGNDVVAAGSALSLADVFDGGAGADRLDLTATVGGFVLTLGASTMLNIETIVLNAGGAYTLTTVDANIGSGQSLLVDGTGLATTNAVVFDASAETNGLLTLLGGAGNDTLSGGALADTLIGAGGRDTLSGGAGNDVFRYNATGDGAAVASNQTAASAGAVADEILAFTTAGDSLVFSAGSFTGVSAGALVNGTNFTSIATAYDGTNAGTMAAWSAGNASFIFDTSTNNLYYDSNGVGAGYTLVAHISSGAVVATDITVV